MQQVHERFYLPHALQLVRWVRCCCNVPAGRQQQQESKSQTSTCNTCYSTEGAFVYICLPHALQLVRFAALRLSVVFQTTQAKASSSREQTLVAPWQL
jgi:hypothetical protein